VDATHKGVWQPGGSFRLSTSAGTAEVGVSASGIRLDRQEEEGVTISVDERAFAHLLFRGFDAAAGERVGTVRDPSLLGTLFPSETSSSGGPTPFRMVHSLPQWRSALDHSTSVAPLGKGYSRRVAQGSLVRTGGEKSTAYQTDYKRDQEGGP
jgi:hypothetical protein